MKTALACLCSAGLGRARVAQELASESLPREHGDGHRVYLRFLLGCWDCNFSPTNGFPIKPLKVKLVAGQQKATELPCLFVCYVTHSVAIPRENNAQSNTYTINTAQSFQSSCANLLAWSCVRYLEYATLVNLDVPTQ